MFLLFERLVEIEIKIESRLHWIDINIDDCIKIFLFSWLLVFVDQVQESTVHTCGEMRLKGEENNIFITLKFKKSLKKKNLFS